MKKIILIGCMTLTSHVFAAPAAKVLFTENKVTATRGGVERPLSRGSILEEGDSITTAAAAAANIQYTNGTLVNLGANSNYKILSYKPKQTIQLKAELSRGKLEQKNDGKIKETLKTPIVSLAILGTQFNVDVECDNSLQNKKTAKPGVATNSCVNPQVYVAVIEGLLYGRNQYIRAGESVLITSNGVSKNVTFPGGSTSSTSTSTSTSSSTPTPPAIQYPPGIGNTPPPTPPATPPATATLSISCGVL